MLIRINVFHQKRDDTKYQLDRPPYILADFVSTDTISMDNVQRVVIFIFNNLIFCLNFITRSIQFLFCSCIEWSLYFMYAYKSWCLKVANKSHQHRSVKTRERTVHKNKVFIRQWRSTILFPLKIHIVSMLCE